MKLFFALIFSLSSSLYALPTCVATPFQTLYAGAYRYGGYAPGTSIKLDGTGSSGAGGLTYAWSQTSGSPTLSFDSTTSSTPTVSGSTVFGSYIFQLIVTDMNGPSTCTVKVGVTAQDSNGIVNTITDLGLTFGTKVAMLTSRYTANSAIPAEGTSTWPWTANRQRAALDAVWSHYGSGQNYGPWWRTLKAGTLTFTGGSAIVTGSGTSLKTDICGGGGTPSGGDWYLAYRYTGTDGVTHYAMAHPTACASETSITISSAYPTNANAKGAQALCDTPCSGLAFALSTIDGSGVAAYMGVTQSSAPGDYYDAWGVSNFIYWLESGDDTYRDRFITIATDWWQNPVNDQGTAYVQGINFNVSYAQRSVSLMGVVFLALYNTSLGDNSTFLGLRNIWPYEKYLITTQMAFNLATYNRINDIREDAYSMMMVAECGIAEIDAMEKASCLTALNTPFGTGKYWTDLRQTHGTDTYYVGIYSSVSTATTLGGAGSATVTNGSASVTLSGVTCPPYPGYVWFWSTATATLPANGAGDSTYYSVLSCSGTALVLASVYTGGSGTRGFTSGEPFTGWVTQSFMLGLLGPSFELTATALNQDSSYNTNRDLARSYVDSIADWENNYGYNVTNTGMYSGVSFTCGHPIPANDSMCGTAVNANGHTADSVEARRTLNAEVVNSCGVSFVRTLNNTTKMFCDKIMSEMYSKPGTGGPTSDANYIASWDPGGFYISGAYGGTTGPKFTGQFWGFPESITWSAQRIIAPVVSWSGVTIKGPVWLGGKITIHYMKRLFSPSKI